MSKILLMLSLSLSLICGVGNYILFSQAAPIPAPVLIELPATDQLQNRELERLTLNVSAQAQEIKELRATQSEMKSSIDWASGMGAGMSALIMLINLFVLIDSRRNPRK